MVVGILGFKRGMTQIFTETGEAIQVTVIEAGPCKVIQKKTLERDGYNAIQLAFKSVRDRQVNQPLKGHFDKAGTEPYKYLVEFRVDDPEQFEVGQELKADLFETGQKVDITGKSKGKGFAGSIKRNNFHRGPMSHGSRYHRRPGSMGALGPNRVFKGRPLPGHMGSEKVTVQNLEVVKADVDKNMILVKGAVPGPNKALVSIKPTVKAVK